jgi:hypothetical protein
MSAFASVGSLAGTPASQPNPPGAARPDVPDQTSTDGSTWTPIYSTTTGTGGTQTLSVSATGRYIRIYGTTRATQYGYSLWELQVFAS